MVKLSRDRSNRFACSAVQLTIIRTESLPPNLQKAARATTRRRRVRQYFYGGGANWEPKIRQLLGAIAAAKAGGGVSAWHVLGMQGYEARY